jgi:hypothetical protein
MFLLFTEPIIKEEVVKEVVKEVPIIKVDPSAEAPHAEAAPAPAPALARRHPPPPPVWGGASVAGSSLVVGGTDGSGTRRVVEVLTQLGVPMVSEDPETYDIHADIVGGWPKIVDPVIAESHGLMYDPSTLSASVRKETTTRITRVLEQARADSKKPESKVLARGGRLAGPGGVQAAGVSFGIKAPVSMVLVPWWREVSPNLKFLHVVRDGRDIAFSANQGPVNKFYKGMYPQAAQRQKSTNLQAIQLWSDWNSQIHEWSLAQPHEKDGHSYGYMLLHTEDLVDERVGVRFGAMKDLAMWVQSDASDDYICCLAIKRASFMGSHDRTARTPKSERQNAAQLKQRYGKWRAQTKKNPKLAEDLHRVGSQGLSLLGYEPLREFADEDTEWGNSGSGGSGYQCTLSQAECGFSEQAADTVDSKPCVLRESTDFRAGSLRIDLAVTPATSAQGCCGECREAKGCSHFTYDDKNNYCYLKSGGGKMISGAEAGSLVSGSI